MNGVLVRRLVGWARSGPRRIVFHLRGMPRMYRPLAKNARGDPRRIRVINLAIRPSSAERKRREEWNIQNIENRDRSIWLTNPSLDREWPWRRGQAFPTDPGHSDQISAGPSNS